MKIQKSKRLIGSFPRSSYLLQQLLLHGEAFLLVIRQPLNCPTYGVDSLTNLEQQTNNKEQALQEEKVN